MTCDYCCSCQFTISYNQLSSIHLQPLTVRSKIRVVYPCSYICNEMSCKWGLWFLSKAIMLILSTTCQAVSPELRKVYVVGIVGLVRWVLFHSPSSSPLHPYLTDRIWSGVTKSERNTSQSVYTLGVALWFQNLSRHKAVCHTT